MPVTSSIQATVMQQQTGLPVRLEFTEDLNADVTGVIAAVLTLLTGVAFDGGFKGLRGRFMRRDLQRFGHELPLQLRFTRLDTGAAIDAGADRIRGVVRSGATRSDGALHQRYS